MALGAAHATRRTRLGVSACRCGLVRRRRRSSAVPLILCGTTRDHGVHKQAVQEPALSRLCRALRTMLTHERERVEG